MGVYFLTRVFRIAPHFTMGAVPFDLGLIHKHVVIATVGF